MTVTTGYECDLCGEYIETEDDSARLTVVYGVREGQELRVDYALSKEGEMLYDPLLLHRDCWLDAASDRFEDVMGETPRVVGSPLITCAICHGQIEEEVDMFGMCEMGALIEAHDIEFVPDQGIQPKGVCFDCLASIEHAWFLEED